jgi:CMP-N-acetylneuraminic acid synthetase
MKALAIIPARKGSKRLADKHRISLLGKPMFSYTIEAVLDAVSIDRIVVSSDDDELRPIAAHYGIEFLERPAKLADDTASLDDAFRHVCVQLRDADGYEPDIVVTMQGNIPVRKPGQIDEVVRMFVDVPTATGVCTAISERNRPEWAKKIADAATGLVEPFMRGVEGFRKQDFPELCRLDGAICAVRAPVLMATASTRVPHAWLGDRLHVVLQEHPMYALEVDYPDEVSLAVFYLLYAAHGEAFLTRLAATGAF